MQHNNYYVDYALAVINCDLIASAATAPEPAELDWLEPNRGHFAGQEPLVIKGSKMTSRKWIKKSNTLD